MCSGKLCSLLLIIVLSATAAAGISPAQQESELSSKILALESKWNEAYKRNDISTMNSLLADDFIITVEDGTTYSKSGYIANAGDGAMHVEISEMSNLKVTLHGPVAVVTGAYHEKGTLNGRPYEWRDRFTDVWLNSEGRWQLIVSHYGIPVKSN